MEASQDCLDVPNGWPVVEKAGVPACALDRQLRYRRVNARWSARFGNAHAPGAVHDRHAAPADRHAASPDDHADGSFLSVVPADRREHWAAALGALVDGRLGHYLDEGVEHGPAGVRQIVMTASPTFAPDGRVDGVLCLRFDVTDARQSAENEQRLTQVLLTSRKLQHFLGNQLALTLGYVELLTFDPRLPDELRDRLDEALRGVIEATETLSMLRSLTRREIPPDDPSIVHLVGPD